MAKCGNCWGSRKRPLFICGLQSDAGKPLVAAVFPVAALAAADSREALHRLDAHDVLRHLVAELAFDAHAQRRAVLDRQRARRSARTPGSSAGAERLPGRCSRSTFPASPTSGPHNGRRRSGLRLQPNERQDVTERHAGPFADRTPALDAIVARDLRAARHRAQLRQRELCGILAPGRRPAAASPRNRAPPAPGMSASLGIRTCRCCGTAATGRLR